jgi:hypothetical protein
MLKTTRGSSQPTQSYAAVITATTEIARGQERGQEEEQVHKEQAGKEEPQPDEGHSMEEQSAEATAQQGVDVAHHMGGEEVQSRVKPDKEDVLLRPSENRDIQEHAIIPDQNTSPRTRGEDPPSLNLRLRNSCTVRKQEEKGKASEGEGGEPFVQGNNQGNKEKDTTQDEGNHSPKRKKKMKIDKAGETRRYRSLSTPRRAASQGGKA